MRSALSEMTAKLSGRRSGNQNGSVNNQWKTRLTCLNRGYRFGALMSAAGYGAKRCEDVSGCQQSSIFPHVFGNESWICIWRIFRHTLVRLLNDSSRVPCRASLSCLPCVWCGSAFGRHDTMILQYQIVRCHHLAVVYNLPILRASARLETS